jgi:hypothetical protein
MVGSDIVSANAVKNIIKMQIIIDTPIVTQAPTPSISPTATPSPTQAPTSTPIPTPTPIPVVMELTIVAANGTQYTINQASMAQFTAITANGGTRSSSGTLANYGAYTGVPIMTLLNYVGGVTSSNSAKVTASDNYTNTYTYQQLNGEGVGTYDSTGSAVTPTQPLTMIVAWYLNSTALASNTGPLRTMYVGSEGLYSSGNMNAKMTIKIEIL